MNLQDVLARSGLRKPIKGADDITINPDFHPKPHQVKGLHLSLRNNRYGLFDEPGVGKSFVAYLYLTYYMLEGNRCMVVMPPALLQQFVTEWHIMMKFKDWRPKIHVLTEGPSPRRQLLDAWLQNDTWPDVLCCSYAMFKKVANDCFRFYDVIAADEAHQLKRPQSDNHKYFYNFIGEYNTKDKAVLLMTGTPIVNDLTDSYGMVKMLTPHQYLSYGDFQNQHCSYVQTHFGARLIGFRNTKDLNRNLYQNARRVTLDSVTDLTKPTVQIIRVSLSSPHRALYNKLVSERMLILKDEVIDAVQAQSLRMKCLRIAMNPDRFSDKKMKNEPVIMVTTLLDSINIHKNKVIIYAYFQETVELLQEKLKEHNPAIIYGKSTQANEQKQKFLTDDTCRVLIANYESGGVGLNLQSVCRHVICAEPISVPGKFKQAVGRVHRTGQKHAVLVYVLRISGTSSPSLTSSMLAKEQDNKVVVGDNDSLMDDLFDRSEAAA